MLYQFIKKFDQCQHFFTNLLNYFSYNTLYGDDQICPILSLGGKGVISVLSNIAPKLTCSITNSFFKKAPDEACFYQLQALPLIESLFAETNPIPIKSAINLIGFDFGIPRLPLVKCSDDCLNLIKSFKAIID